MTLRDLNTGQGLGLHRGDPVVCVPVYGAYELFSQCLISLLRHTPTTAPILICDDGNPDPRFRTLLEDSVRGDGKSHNLYYLRQPSNRGFVDTANAAMTMAAPGDLVLLNSDCMVSEGWLESLRSAAYSESRIATATALTNAGTILSIPDRNRPQPQLPHDLTLEHAAQAVRRMSLRLRPDVPTCVGHCVYIRRSAIELVGGFDTVFSPGYEEEVDFSQRCLLHGLRHVVADDVFVLHRHSGSFGLGEEATRGRAERHAIIRQRYPYYDPWVEEVSETREGPLARSLAIATCALRGIRVAIDGRCLGATITGTQLVTLGVIAALDRHTDVALRVLVPDDLGPWAREFLSERPHIRLTRRDQMDWSEPMDVVHRPYQVTSAEDLGVLRRLGDRLVLTQLDNIALRNPGYFLDYDAWKAYREVNHVALSSADQVVFISRDSAADARNLGLVAPERINVVPPATDQAILGLDVSPRAPVEADRLTARPFLFCLGTDFLHKNRVFAFRLLEALNERGFDGVLAFGGPRVAAGSSAGEEAEYLLSRPGLSERVFELGAVDEAVKRWLFEHAAAVVYPTTSEGFGLTPFEAAEAGTPCLFASHTSLAEVLPASAALLTAWDPQESARRCAPVLMPGESRDQLVRTIRISGARFTSLRNARGLADVYAKAVRSPGGAGRGPGGEQVRALEAESIRRELRAIYEDPLNRGLVGPDAVLPPELRRAVLAVATRPLLRRTATALYRVGYVVRHGPGKRPAELEETTS